jgi:hypothetical protein
VLSKGLYARYIHTQSSELLAPSPFYLYLSHFFLSPLLSISFSLPFYLSLSLSISQFRSLSRSVSHFCLSPLLSLTFSPSPSLSLSLYHFFFLRVVTTIFKCIYFVNLSVK